MPYEESERDADEHDGDEAKRGERIEDVSLDVSWHAKPNECY
jgi:hypothetical protein